MIKRCKHSLTLCFLLAVGISPLFAAHGAFAYEPGWRLRSAGLDGGTIIELAVSTTHTTDGLLYAVTDEGRLFRSSDGIWSPIRGELTGKVVKSVVFSPNFSVDHEVFIATSSSGVYVYNDKQESWRSLGLAGNDFRTIMASPEFLSDQSIYVAGHQTFYQLTSDGQNQTQLANGILANDLVWTIVFSPDFAQDRTIYAGTDLAGVVRSTDGGSSWSVVGVADKQINDLVIANVPNNPATLFAATANDGIFRSTDGGDSWAQSFVGLPDGRVGALGISPAYATDTTVYVGLRLDEGLFKSENGGDSWIKISSPQLPVGMRSIILSNDTNLYAGLDKDVGVVASTDGGNSWNGFNSGLTGLSIGDLALWSNLADQTALFARAYPAGLYRSDDLGQSWTSIYGENLPQSRLVQAIGVSPDFGNDQTLYTTIQYAGVWRSQSAGANWSKISKGLPPSSEIRALILSPDFRQDDTLFVGTRKGTVYRSRDRGDRWQQVYTATVGAAIDALIISPNFGTDQTLFAAVGDTVLHSTNGGDDWIPPRSGLDSRRYRILAISPRYAEDTTIYAAYNGTRLYRSEDGGRNWGTIATLPSAPYQLVVSPDFVQNGTLYAALTDGVYVSSDRGQSWNAIQANSQIWSVEALVISQGLVSKLYAGTRGSSVWQYNTDLPSPNLSCGDVISENVTLDTDLSCTGKGLVVSEATDIAIDCAGHTINRILDAQQPFPSGIEIVESTGIEVRNCTITNFHKGIVIFDSSDSLVRYNTLTGNDIAASVESLGANANGNVIANNSIFTSQFGITVSPDSSENIIKANTIHDSLDLDVKVRNGSNTVTGNTITGKGMLGIQISTNAPVTVTANTVTGREVGLALKGSGSLVTGNTWRANITGVEVQGNSTNNLIYNNLFSNTTNVTLEPTVGSNRWHVEQTTGTNIIGGTFLGGNFWAGPDETGYSQSCIDGDQNGICDEELGLDANNMDQRPLTLSSTVEECNADPLWSIIIYLNGDNDLESWTRELFNRLEEVADNPCIQIVVLWDQSETGDTSIYWVQADRRPSVLANYVEDINTWPQGELDMGNPQTLINFVIWARERFPAQHELLSIVGHGNGWSPSAVATPRRYFHSGISFDDNEGGSYLSTGALRSAFGVITQDGTEPLDLVYFDACLMAMAETLHPMRNFASYLVASENESFTSYPYDRYLRSINANTSPESLAITIVNEHHQSLIGYPRTLAAFDLSRMDDVNEAINEFLDALMEGDQISEVHRTGLLTAFDQVQKLDSNVDLSIDNKDGYVDLYHFVELIQDQTTNTDVRNAAQSILNRLAASTDPLIIRNQADSGRYEGEEWSLENANGLSIYLPLGEPDWRLDFYNEHELSFAEDTAWNEFVQAMVSIADIDNDERPDEIAPSDRPGPLRVSSITSILFLPHLVR